MLPTTNNECDVSTVSKNEITISEIATLLDGEIITGKDKLDLKVDTFGATDLLSDLLAMDLDNYGLITGLNNSQVVRTAEITNAVCIIIVRNKKPELSAVTIANRSGIPLILSPLTMFEACSRLGRFIEKIRDGN